MVKAAQDRPDAGPRGHMIERRGRECCDQCYTVDRQGRYLPRRDHARVPDQQHDRASDRANDAQGVHGAVCDAFGFGKGRVHGGSCACKVG